MDGTSPHALPELKPCPFCGSAGELEFDNQIGEWFASCSDTDRNCDVIVCCGPFPTAEQAAAAWNKRAHPEL